MQTQTNALPPKLSEEEWEGLASVNALSDVCPSVMDGLKAQELVDCEGLTRNGRTLLIYWILRHFAGEHDSNNNQTHTDRMLHLLSNSECLYCYINEDGDLFINKEEYDCSGEVNFHN